MKILSQTAKKTLFLTLIIVSAARALADDMQVDIDREAKIKYITANLEKKLLLFPEYKTFMEARLYKTGDTTYSLVLLYQFNDTIARKTFQLDENGLKEFRAKIAAKLALTKTSTALDQDGRSIFLAATTLYSLGLYGPLFNSMLDINQVKNIVAVECIVGSAGFFVPFWLTYDRQVTDASAFSYIYFTIGGAAHGYFARQLIFGDSMVSKQGTSPIVLGMSLAEGISGFLVAEKLKLSTGQVDISATGLLWGTIWTYEALFVVSDMDKNSRAGGAALLAGSIGGTCLGYYMSTVENYSRGDVLVQNMAAFLGAYCPLAVAKVSGAQNPKVFTGSSLIGSLAGMAAGYYAIRDKHFSTGQGGLIMLGEFAGLLLGMGTAYYFSPDNTALSLSLSSAGALIGFSALYYLFYNTVVISDRDNSWNIQIMPLGMAGLLQKPDEKSMRPAGRGVNSDWIPLLLVEYKF